MSIRARLILFVVAAAGLVGLFVEAFGGLPRFGRSTEPYGDIVNSVTMPARRITEAVGAVNFDIRAFDTVGEEFILFAAVIGVTLSLRASRRDEERGEPRDEAERRRVPETSDAVRVWGLAFVGITILFGLYVAAHANITPGGGFQGGVVLATALLLVYLAGEYLTFETLQPHRWVESSEGIGAGGFVAVGLLTMAVGGVFLKNSLPLGHPGELTSGGLIPIVNVLITVAVAAGFALMLTEFLEQTLLIRAKTARRRGRPRKDRS